MSMPRITPCQYCGSPPTLGIGRIEQLTEAANPGPIPDTVFTAAAVAWSPSPEQMRKAYDRYEYVRTLSPHDFAVLWERALGVIPFDDLVDAAITQRAALRR
jgi:hypothetical protein